MKVLVADDDILSRNLIEMSLQHWGYEVVMASDGLEASHILQQPDCPRLAVLDWLMPGLDGVQLCHEIRHSKNDSYTYVLLLTTKDAKADVIQGLEAGADDYMTKPFDSEELRVRLRTGGRILYLLDQLATVRETVRELATRDSLTRLWDRKSVIDLLTDELNRAERQGSFVGVILFDLDRFRQINETYGHLAADEVLQQVAEMMRSIMRPYDSVGRYGGEEFLAVLPGCNEVNAVSHAERLRDALRCDKLSTLSGEIAITASFGVTVAGPGCYGNASMAIRLADAVMFAAKRAGGDMVEFLAQLPELTLT